jgi:hypothetical protein
MKKAALLIIISMLLIPSFPGAETIYTWKGRDGAKKFSNEPPPEDVKDYKTIETLDTETENPDSEGLRRSSFDQMVQQASKKADASNQRRIKETAEKAQEQQRIAQEKQTARRQAERKRLESQIEAIEGRAVSRTYPNGMKQAQIEALRKEIEKLELGPSPDTAREQ